MQKKKIYGIIKLSKRYEIEVIIVGKMLESHVGS